MRASLAVSALALLAAAATLWTPAAAAAPANIKHCYLFSSGVDDLGYSFSFNVARLKINSALEAAFPSSNVSSAIVQNVIRMPLEEQREALARLVAGGCNVVVSNSQTLLHKGNYPEVSALYPNVTFFTVPLRHEHVLNNDLPNFVYMVQVPREAFYLNGAAAARQASTCVGIMSAWELGGNPMDAVNGAVRGIRDENPTIPIHVVTMNSWFWPDGEADAARLLMRMGCEVLLRYSNPRTADLTIANEAPEQDRFFSVGIHADLQQYVGDSVLASTYVAWDVGLTPLITQALRDGRPDYAGAPYAFARGVVTTTDLSPRASPGARAALARAQARVASRADVLCGVMALRNGTVVNSDPSACFTITQQTALYLGAPNTTFHGPFQHRSECPAGTFATYTTTPVLGLTCTPCPADTYTAEAGETSCSACPNGTIADAGSSLCRPAPLIAVDGGLAAWAIVVIVLAAVLVASGGGIGAGVLTRRGGANHDAAPKKGPLCLLFTDIESSTALWQAHDRMNEAVETHHRVIREVIAEYGGYEVKTVGDSFMIAVTGVVDAVMIAVAIQRGLQAAEWPDSLRYLADDAEMYNGLKVRIGVHYCEEVEPKYEAERDYWDYYGPDVNLSARVESQARGGQILLSHMTLEALRADEAFEGFISPDMHISLFARNVELKGVAAPVTLYSVTPVELANRKFEPLEGYEMESAGNFKREGSSSSLYSSMAAEDGHVSLSQRSILSVLQRLFTKLKPAERSSIMKTLTGAWDGTAKARPVAHQMRAVATSAAVQGAGLHGSVTESMSMQSAPATGRIASAAV